MGLDFQAPEFRRDPHLIYRRLRKRGPITWDDRLRAWVVVSHREVVLALKHPKLVSGPTSVGDAHDDLSALVRMVSSEILYLNPPRHGVVRGCMGAGFGQGPVGELATIARRTARRLVESVRDRGRMDVMQEVARPLTVAVAYAILGVPSRDRERIEGWKKSILELFQRGGKERVPAAVKGHAKLRAYVLRLVEKRRKEPGRDPLSAMIADDLPEAPLGDDDWVANCLMILSAGTTNPANLIGNTILHLLRRPKELARALEDPALVDSAIEETLRFESPVHLAARRASEDLRLGRKKIRAGDRVLLLLASANRDPERFSRPDHFSMSGERKGHVAFGHGIHYCLGHEVARLEAKITVKTLLERLPRLRLLREPVFGEIGTLRGPLSLHIAWTKPRVRGR